MNKIFTSKLTCIVLAFGILGSVSNAQISFVNSNSLLHNTSGILGSNANNRSGNSMTVVDINNDGLDDICKLADNGEVRIEYQQLGGTFNYQYLGNLGASSCWAMCMGDVDKNGYKDALLASGASLVLVKINASGVMSTVTLPNSGFFQQNINFMDVNGDGWIDIFACDDNDYSKLYLNDGAGNFPSEALNSVINFDITPGQVMGTSNDDSGNYGSVWTDFDNDGDVDLYIAKCRQSVSSGTDPRRIDVVFVNNGNGTYTEMGSSLGLNSGDQDWTGAFGDIDNDGDFDLFLTKHNTTSRYYLNDGTGHFTPSNTLAFGSMPMQSQYEDLDNDGFVDLIITGDNDHKIYHNNGNGTFTNVTPSALTVGGTNMLSFASGDLNHDGKIDIYASYGSTYNTPSTTTDDVLWLNSTSNSNHFITLVLTSTISNNDELGARAFIYGPWGVQTREVRAGESYGTLNSAQLHFGLGANTSIDSVVVNWPSGVHTVIPNPVPDQFLSVIEQNPCTLSSVTISASGPTVLCTGGSVTLSAPTGTGYSYLWSTGATTSSILVSSPGTYAVTVSESSICNFTSPSTIVTLNPNETPTITASSDTSFCQGGSVLLSSTSAQSYLWSNGATTQTINVTNSGAYSVVTQGTCQQWNSNSINVTVLAAPLAPSSNDVTIPSPGTANLSATGTNLTWYDAAVAGNIVSTGSNYSPFCSTNTSFWVEDANLYGGLLANVGEVYPDASSPFSGNTFNSWTIFNVNQNCTLKKVKVYTDTPGNRLIELRNSSGVVLQDTLVNITTDSMWVNLNFNLSVGNAYQLGTNTAQNNASFGFVSPRLKRSNLNVAYPYTVAGVIDLINSNQGSSFFYYFYDWEIEQAPVSCAGPRTQVNVFVTSVGIDAIAEKDGLEVYPNPASDYFTVDLSSLKLESATLSLYDLLGKKVIEENFESKNNPIKEISVKTLNKGIYQLSIRSGEKIYRRKLVIE